MLTFTIRYPTRVGRSAGGGGGGTPGPPGPEGPEGPAGPPGADGYSAVTSVEAATGTINDVNVDFTTATLYDPTTDQCYVDGILDPDAAGASGTPNVLTVSTPPHQSVFVWHFRGV